MAIINGVDMPNFTHKEIPKKIERFVDRRILENTQSFREILDHPFAVSKNKDAIVRFKGRRTSCHRVMIDPIGGKTTKQSTAIDGFPDCDIFEAFTVAVSSGLFVGVGVYFDTQNNKGKEAPMLHLDLRPNPLIWVRDGNYFYPHHKSFYIKLLNLFLINRR